MAQSAAIILVSKYSDWFDFQYIKHGQMKILHIFSISDALYFIFTESLIQPNYPIYSLFGHGVLASQNIYIFKIVYISSL